MINKNNLKKLILPVLVIGSIFLFRITLAQDFGIDIVDETLGGTLGETGSDPREIISRIINIALGFLGVIAVGIVLYAGVLWMNSKGEEEKVSKAKQILKTGVIGLAIIMSAWLIVTFVISKLSGAISGDGSDGSGSSGYCLTGETRDCGCGGVMTCNNGHWGLCLGSNKEDCLSVPINCDASSLSGCQASNQICLDNYFCNQDCLCEEKSSLGEVCSAKEDVCQADNSRCASYLTCDPDLCVCVGSPVITAVSPMGGFCNLNINQPCLIDSDCQAGDTCNQKTPNGNSDNLITIFGHNFGNYEEGVSQVLFSTLSGETAALLPQKVNPSCIDSWSDKQIIVAVPEGAETGPIKLINFEEKSDTSNDEHGPELPDFVINSIARPGLCLLDPVEGNLSNEVNYQGVNLYSGEAYFGNYESNVGGIYSNFNEISGLSGIAAVPNIKAGVSSSFVEREVNGVKQKSNFLQFNKAREEADGPFIMTLAPDRGSSGQYITIRGAGFGGARGSNRVYFVSGNNKIEANYTFPAVCLNSVWQDKQIIVKVPDNIPEGSYYLEIVLNNNKTISSKSASPNTFLVDYKISLAPSLCKIDPEKGPIGTPVTLWGEYFGKTGDNILTKFTDRREVVGKIEYKNKTNEITVAVPQQAATGPVTLVKGGQSSNELNFMVAECSADSECLNQICCPANTYKKGRCVDEIEDCFIDIPTSVFESKFNTIFNANGFDPVDGSEDFASCRGLAIDLGACFQGGMCPNSPGSCSSPSVSYKQVVDNCNITCNDVPGCTAATCTYNDKLNRCVLNTKATNFVSACEVGELIAPSKNSNSKDDRHIPRIMYWQGRVNQHWNLSTGEWETDPDMKSGAEINKLTYCQKFYPTTVVVEEYKNEFSNNWQDGVVGNYHSSIKKSYRCILGDDVKSLNLAGVKKTCNQNGQWEITTTSSCPDNWIKGSNNNCIQENSSCSACPTNLTCEKVNLYNSCVSNTLCQTGAVCVDNEKNELDDCVLTVEPSCDCCCRIGFDQQDCCSFTTKTGEVGQLTCRGVCGSDIIANSNTYGSCSGCAAAGDTQAEQDAACNCERTSGKFCLITKTNPQGICVDCASLTTQEECGAHFETCCFDSRGTESPSDDVCRAIGNSQVISKDINSPDYGYCGYFKCQVENPLICSGLPVKNGKYKKLADCEKGCPKDSGDICNNFNNNPEKCIAESSCCYDVNAILNHNSSDHGLVNNCVSGQRIDSGDYQGYCAYYNCESQEGGDPSQCNQEELSHLGKFKGLQSCITGCQELFGNRPVVRETMPKISAEGVCRNSSIKISFNQRMDTASFFEKGNFILLEEKTSGERCPDGTYLVLENKNSNLVLQSLDKVWQKISYQINLLFNKKKAVAISPPSKDKAYCQVSGRVNFTDESYLDNQGKEVGATSLIFAPDNILLPNNNYYVILQGGRGLETLTGILSSQGKELVGLGMYLTEGSRPINPAFNGRTYRNIFGFGFKTLGEQNKDDRSGVCELGSVVLTPSSYLFQRTDNDIKENDSDPTDKAFDTVSDGDKLFVAQAYSLNGQLITPVNGYNWDWDWIISGSDKSLISFSDEPVNLPENSRLVVANPQITDGQTQLTVMVNMDKYINPECSDNCNNIYFGNKFFATSNIYVFSCVNPWPKVKDNGTWEPWIDQAKCLNSESCNSYNYKFYYCRDAGESGTFDDLPVISPDPISMGMGGGLVCSGDKTPCHSSGSVCENNNGICVWEVLKETYFFSDPILSGIKMTGLRDTGNSGEVEVKWQSIVDGVNSFKIYYLEEGQSVMRSKEIKTSACKEINVEGEKNYECAAVINQLKNEKKYIFQISLLTANKVESALSNKMDIIPSDQVIPDAPKQISAKLTDKGIKFSWEKNSKENVYYRFYFGVGSYFGASYDTQVNVNEIELSLDNFPQTIHILAVSAISESGNESEKSVTYRLMRTSNTTWLKVLNEPAVKVVN